MALIYRFNYSPNPAVKDFRQHVENQNEDHVHDGVDGRGETRQFICLTGLTNYLTAERISALLGLEDITPLNEFLLAEIICSYFQVFSILCYIGYPGAILHFIVSNLIADRDLPLSRLPSFDGPREENSIHSKQFWSSFYHAQWRFIPMVFGDGMHETGLSVDQILPIRGQMKLDVRTGMTDTKIYKVTLHECCNRLPVHEVVFKTFNANLTPTLSNLWETEAAAYAKIFRQPTAPSSKRLHLGEGEENFNSAEGVVKCFGSFKQRDSMETKGKASPQSYTHFIILEYTAGGTLADLVKNTASHISSSKYEDQLAIWNQVFQILVGIQTFHSLNIGHQDMKASNILDRGTDPADPNRPRFVVADFGTAVDGDKLLDGTSSGSPNSSYAAPECVRGSTFADLPRPADLWALGCVFSEMLIRFRLGDEGVVTYTKLRKEELRSKTRLQGQNRYHDGVKRLSCVDEMHRRALEGCRHDSILHLVSRIILDMMLQPIEVRKRVSAGEIRAAWLEGLEKLEKMRRDMAKSQLVVVRRTAPSRTQGGKGPGCFSKAIVICPSWFMIEPLSPPVRWEFSGQLRRSFDHQARLGWTSISLGATIMSLLTTRRIRGHCEGNKTHITEYNLAVTSGAVLAPRRQPTRKSLNRHLENVLLMVLVWFGVLAHERGMASCNQGTIPIHQRQGRHQ